MAIKRFEVAGLPGHRDGTLVRELHPDLNIITGRNGSGKTTLLKLLWYITSGNIEHAIKEIPFSRASVDTDEYSITLIRMGESSVKIELEIDGVDYSFEDHFDEDASTYFSAEDEANGIVKNYGSSVFFPTFRRIEGGFSLSTTRTVSPGRVARARTDIEEALLTLSRRLTMEKHTFVSAISTVDIVSLMLRQYTELSEQSNLLQRTTSDNIINQIKQFKRDDIVGPVSHHGKSVEQAEHVLDTIRNVIEQMELDRVEIMSPLDAIRVLVEKLFRHAGIRLGARLSFGSAADAVSSDALSAGEKQMLSFICYNAVYRDSTIFIDEPELSLHVDWQRQLFPTMASQGSRNQFIIATHSPFIYSKYPDKEIMISSDRGDMDSDVD